MESEEKQNILTMEWMGEAEKKDLVHVQKIRDAISAAKGLLHPEENQRALGYMTHYHTLAMERAAQAKAMQDEEMANMLETYMDLPIGRAKAIAQGGEFGKKHTYYKNLAASYGEMINTLKKNIAYYEGSARNQW